MRLKTAPKATRPTTDRVKESVFSILESMGALEGTRVLDLFAGTGALGLEAVSRGAASAVFVEKNRETAAVCKQNLDVAEERLQKANINVELNLITKPAESYLTQGKLSDLAFVDPPYDMSNQQLNGILGNLFGRMEVKIAVVERSSKSSEPRVKSAQADLVKNYGETTVYFFVRDDVQ